MVAFADTVALLVLTLEPLPEVVTVVVDAPLINAEPSGTLLALAVIDAVAVKEQAASITLTHEAVTEEVALTIVCISPCV